MCVFLSKKEEPCRKTGCDFSVFRTALSFIGILFSHCDHDLLSLIHILLFFELGVRLFAVYAFFFSGFHTPKR